MAKEKASKDFFTELENKFNAYFEPDEIKTGIIPLDLVLNGGLQTGSLIEIAGESQCGKSTLVLHLAKNLAERGYKTFYIDSEGSVKDDMVRGIGLEPYLASKKKKDNKFMLIRESRYSQVEQLINMALETGDYKLFVIDSLTALGNDEYINIDSEKNAIDTRIGMDAQLNSRLLKKLNALKTDYNCIFIIINQTRVDLSMTFKPTKTSTGGQAVKFYPDIRLFMKVDGKIEEKKELLIGEKAVRVGATGTIEARKSRLGAGFIPYPFTIYFGKGVSSLAAYEALLPGITVNGKPALEQITKMTYELHLPSGDYKSTNGVDAMKKMIVDHGSEVEEMVNDYLDDYYDKIRNDKLLSKGETIVAVQASTDSIDDYLDE